MMRSILLGIRHIWVHEYKMTSKNPIWIMYSARSQSTGIWIISLFGFTRARNILKKLTESLHLFRLIQLCKGNRLPYYGIKYCETELKYILLIIHLNGQTMPKVMRA